MKLSIVYTPSLKNIRNAFDLIRGGLALLIGMEVSIEHEMTSEEFAKLITDDLDRQRSPSPQAQ